MEADIENGRGWNSASEVAAVSLESVFRTRMRSSASTFNLLRFLRLFSWTRSSIETSNRVVIFHSVSLVLILEVSMFHPSDSQPDALFSPSAKHLVSAVTP